MCSGLRDIFVVEGLASSRAVVLMANAPPGMIDVTLAMQGALPPAGVQD